MNIPARFLLLAAALVGYIRPSDRELTDAPALAVVNAHFAPGLPWRISVSRSFPLNQWQIAENIADAQAYL